MLLGSQNISKTNRSSWWRWANPHQVDLLIRCGTSPSSSACLSVDKVAGAAVISVLDEMRWVPEVYIALEPGFHSSKSIEDKVVRAIETVIGKIAPPKHVHIVPKIVERIRVMVQGEAKVATSRSAVNSGVRLSASAVKVIRSEPRSRHRIVSGR